MPETVAARYLAFAFASADLLFDLDARGCVIGAMGAVKRATGLDPAFLPGQSWRVLVAERDHGLVEALFDGLGSSGRRGPVRFSLRAVNGRTPQRAALCAIRLPQLDGGLSCAVSLSAPQLGERNGEDGGALMDRAAFERVTEELAAAAEAAGMEVEVALVEFAGLQAELQGLSAADAEAAAAKLSDALRAESLGGSAAAQLEPDRFAVMRQRSEAGDDLSGRLQRVAAGAGLKAGPSIAALPITGASAASALKALRHTLDGFLKHGLGEDGLGAGDLTQAFRRGVETTLDRARSFSACVAQRRFDLVFQPVVALKDRRAHHYECLARFPGEESPAETIRMAEELNLTEGFDLAVAELAVAALHAADPSVHVAVNLSACSLMAPGFVERLLVVVAPVAKRLSLEITESAVMDDMERASERLERLRHAGLCVCLDDFGAGAASFAYLRALRFDVVKIDGQYVRGLTEAAREAVLIRHLAALCRDLKIETVAEFVETEGEAALLAALGVDLGQGFLFGRPQARLPEPGQVPAAAAGASLKAAVRPAKRRGASEQWG